MVNWLELRENPRLNKIYKQRLKILRLIREFFWSNNFEEVQTSSAVILPSQEPYLNPISLEFSDANKEKIKFYLQTSPEFSMKKLLAGGFDNIFQICQCFRNEESFGGLHNPEFTMIEWYRQSSELKDIMNDIENLFKFIAEKLGVKFLIYKKNKIHIFKKWDKKTMKSIWLDYLGVNLDEFLDRKSIAKLSEKIGFKVDDGDRYEDLFFKIFLNKIEPNLGKNKPIFIYDYPAQMCSLSKLSKNDERYAERFELYISGVEIANAFGELTDSKEQKRRLELDRSLRKELKKEVWNIDLDFLDALKFLKDKNVSGVALGLDRMVLLFSGANNLNEVIFQSVQNQIDN